jgi:hypothetical protein
MENESFFSFSIAAAAAATAEASDPGKMRLFGGGTRKRVAGRGCAAVRCLPCRPSAMKI